MGVGIASGMPKGVRTASGVEVGIGGNGAGGYFAVMRRLILIAAVGAAGCSNAPIAGFLDTVAPCKAGRDDPTERRPPANIAPTDLPPAVPARPRDMGTLPPPADFAPSVGPRP